MSEENDAVLTERRGRVLLITLNRPDARNAINGALANGLKDAVRELDEDTGLSAGVITGSGNGFSAGMDLKAFVAGEDISGFLDFVRGGPKKPLIGAVEGFALAGGLEIALTCDLLVAAEGTRFGIREVKVGLFAAAGGLLRLPTRVGYAAAMQMALTGEPILAEEALARGLVVQVTEAGAAVDAATALAEQIAENAPLALAASKELINVAVDATAAEFWERQNELMVSVMGSNDAREGAVAFAEKRTPNWTGT